MKHLRQISLSLPNSSLLLFVFLFLCTLTVRAQVTIREKIEISTEKNTVIIKSKREKNLMAVSHSIFLQCSGILTFKSNFPATNGFGDHSEIWLVQQN
jgi:hypothetical protein